MPAWGQFGDPTLKDIENDDLEIGGDIFADFYEDLDTAQVAEDERFFYYGRFFTFAMGVGNTTFSGNRGIAYEDEFPSWNLGISFFLNFRVSLNLGVSFSQHNFVINGPTRQYDATPGLIEVSMLRPYFGFRYYIDTADLGTAITYSNPYMTMRLEYWYQRNKFVELEDSEPTQSGGGLGVGLGGGLEFPIVLKEYYLNVEFLYHIVSFFDKNTQDYRATQTAGLTSEETFDDLSGDAVDIFVSFVINW